MISSRDINRMKLSVNDIDIERNKINQKVWTLKIFILILIFNKEF